MTTSLLKAYNRWMGETKVLIETVHPQGMQDIQKLEQLNSNFQDARFIWETQGKAL